MKSNKLKSSKSLIIFSLLSAFVMVPTTYGFGPNKYSDTGPSITTKQSNTQLDPSVRPTRSASGEKVESTERSKPKKTLFSFSKDNPSGAGFIPSNAKPGECYAQVIIPPQYEDVTERVMVKEASYRIEITPAEYAPEETRVMVKAPTKKIEVVPAEYKTVKEKIRVAPPSSRMVEVPAKYDYVEEKVLVNPARTVWQKGENPLSEINGKTGEIVCLVELPAEYKTVRKTVVVEPATVRSEEYDGEFEYIERVVEVTPATTRVVEIPAEYEVRTVQKAVKPEQKKKVEIPAEYKTVTRKKKIVESKTEWVRVICETNLTAELVYNIQKALKDRGFDPGVLDGVYGASTKLALENFQTQNELPRGSLDYDTLKALRINI